MEQPMVPREPARIPARHVAKVDQDYATARSNLRLHVADVQKFLDRGDSPETAFVGFAQALLPTGPYHLAVMLAAAVVQLVQSNTAVPRAGGNWPEARPDGRSPLRVTDGNAWSGLEIEVNGARWVLAAYNRDNHIWHISPINQQACDTGLLQITRDVLHDAETVRKYPR